MQPDDVTPTIVPVPEIVFIGVGQDAKGKDIFAWVAKLPDEAMVDQLRAAHQIYLKAMRKKRKVDLDDENKPVRVGVFGEEILLDTAKRLAAKDASRVVGWIEYGSYALAIVKIPKEETQS